jgi:tRNA threonylcarbamoyladenosine biosynthesis protein TsaE
VPPSPVVEVPDAQAMRALGASTASRLRAGDIVLLVGPLGAGKTTFVQGVADGLDVVGTVTSPTFVIAREHSARGVGPALVHVDAYRLGGVGEVDDLDLDASLHEAVTVVEWGEGLIEHLDAQLVRVKIARDLNAASESEVRFVTVDWPEGRP